MKQCKCGAIACTDAAWKLKSPRQRQDFLRKINSCETCKRDRKK